MMNEDQFLGTLDKYLKKLPKEERQDILHDFKEHFEIGKMEGKSEKEISESLGSPNKIAKEMIASYHLEKVETNASAGDVLRAVWAVIGLSFFNLVIVLGPFIAIAGLVLGGWAVGISFTISPLLVLINLFIYPDTFLWFDFFISFVLSGVGLFITIGMYFATRLLIRGFTKYLQVNVKFVKGGLKNA